jgi:uncharacterized protein YndB with AHSA1/START domain
MSDTAIEKTVFLGVPVDTAWAFLTKADKLEQWFFKTDADFEVGAAYTLYSREEEGAKRCWGEVLEMSAPSRLRQSFTIAPLGGVMTELLWELNAVEGGTRIKLTHTGLEAAGEAAFGLMSALDDGWDKHFAHMREAVAS